MSRRRVFSARRYLAILTCVVPLAAACAPSAVPAQPAPPPVAPAAPAAMKQGGTFIMPAVQATPHLNFWPGGSFREGIALNQALEKLLMYDFQEGVDWRAGFTVKPGLAERWENPSPTTYVFHIRKGVKWHDGMQFTAEDVKWAYEELMNPANAYAAAANLALVESMEVADPYTLKLTLKGPSAVFLEGLGDRRIAIQSRHVAARGEKFENVVVGTGPYKLESYDRQKGVSYVRNPDYWQPGRPGADKVRVVWPLEASAMMAAFVAKQVDLVKVQDKAQFDVLQRQVPDMKHFSFVDDANDEVFMKLDHPPFDDPRVRRALHLALDRQQMVQVITFGQGIMNPPAVNGGRKGWVLSQEELGRLPGWRQPKDADLAEARRLLAEAGHSQGVAATVRFPGESQSSNKNVEMVAEQARRVGFDLKLEAMERGVFLKAAAEGDYQVLLQSLGSFAPERPWRGILHSRGAQNTMPVRDPELDALIDRQAVELDVEKRKQLFLQIQRHLLDKMYVLPLIAHAAFVAQHPYVHGWIDNYAGQAYNMDWSQLWLDVEKLPPGR